MPCEGYAGHKTAKWMYKRNNTFEILVNEANGFTFYKTMKNGPKILNNFSLQISHFSDLNEGTYYCQVCTQKCNDSKQISLIAQYGTFCPSVKRQFIIQGDSFSYSCPHRLDLKLGWKFDTHVQNTATPVKRKLRDKGFLLILDVQPSDAGEYNCWREISTGLKHIVCTVALCVLTVADMKMSDSPQICTLYCDMDIEAEKESTIVYVTDKWNISIASRVNNSKSSVSCSLHRSSVKMNRPSSEMDHATTQSDITSGITVNDASITPSRRAVFISMLTAVFFILIIIVIICLWVLQRANTDKSSDRHFQQTTRCSE
ncbi:hypothetical protein P4O66_010264, partial [Electrophorus voltai]